MEVLLVRFPKYQRDFIRRKSKQLKVSDAEFVRMSVEIMIQEYKRFAPNNLPVIKY